jgi:hypothetical protein
MPLYRYLFGYAWLTFVIEENINRTNTNKNSRYIFDINTANKLPVFPYTVENFKWNPYFIFLVNDMFFDS